MTKSYAPDTWAFWRNLAVYFCVWSVIGHWLEIVYCSFMNLFGIVADDSLVWDDPFYPFLVYGIGAVLFALILVPLKELLVQKRKTLWGALLQFFFVTVLLCMLMELAMGFMLNQPNAAGEYPLWDNSALPLNIFSQAWLVNDLVLGALALLYVWLIYPWSEKLIARINPTLMNVISVVVLVSFIVLCVVKFT